MNPICFYHKADLDGVCSAAIVKHFVPECELYGIDYGDEFPWDKADAPATGGLAVKAILRTVYMADFSLPIEDMKRLAEVSNLVWIDHHKSAIQACLEADLKIRGLRDTRLAACELAWTWFDQDQRIPGNVMIHKDTFAAMETRRPEAVKLLGIYDNWRKDDPEWERALAFQYGMRCEPGIYDPASYHWDCLLCGYENADGASVSGNTERGTAVLHFIDQQNAQIAKAGAFKAYLFPPNGPFKNTQVSRGTYEGWPCICLNTQVFNSQAFEAVYDPEKHDVMVPFALQANGKWKVSLYSEKPEVDCSAIAKAFGGGGHKGAAGFVCDNLPWGHL